MKIKALLYTIIIFVSSSLFSVEYLEMECIKPKFEKFKWDGLPRDIKMEILQYFTDWKLDSDRKFTCFLAVSLLENVKRYREAITLSDKEFGIRLTSSFKDYLNKNLTHEDYLALNKHVCMSICWSGLEYLPKNDVNLLTKLLMWLNRMDEENGQVALALACSKSYKDTADLLIKAGMNINAEYVFTGYLLGVESFAGNKEMVEFLISSGADVNAVDKVGKTALDWAKEKRRNKTVIKLLKEKMQIEEPPRKCSVM